MKQRMNWLIMLTMALCVIACAAPVPTYAIGADEVKQTDVYLVLDNSKSMKKTDPQKLLDEAVQQFFNATPLGSDVGVITYSGAVLDKGNLKEKKTAADRMEAYTYDQNGKGTNIGDALTAARDMLADNQHNPNKAVVLITDGADNAGSNYNLSIEGQVIPTYCIYINDGSNEKDAASRDYLSRIARDTGTKDYYELADANEIESIMNSICNDIYGVSLQDIKPESVELAADEPKDVGVTIEESVYTAIITFEHSDQVALKITDPDQRVIYDADDSTLSKGSDMLNVEAGQNLTSVSMLWPDAGEYIFTVSSKIAQTIKLTIIPYTANIDLKLDAGIIDPGGTVKATCTIENGDSVAKKVYARLHDSSGNVLADSIEMTGNGDGTFSTELDFSNIKAGGTCSVVALAETEDGKTLASNKQMIKVKKTTEPKKGFPVIILILIILILAAAAVIIKKVVIDGKKDDNGYITTSPISPVCVKILGGGGKGMLVYANLQSIDIPEGRETELYEALSKRAQDPSLIPEDVKSVTVACEAPKNATADQSLVVRVYRMDDPNALKFEKTLGRNSGHRDLAVRLDSGDDIQFQWVGGHGGRR